MIFNAIYRTSSILALLFCLLAITPASAQYSLELSEAYGGSNDDFGTAVAFGPDGTYVLAGFSESSDMWLNENKGSTDFWIMHFNAEGDTLWSRNYGGFNGDNLHDITFNSTGTIAAFGTTRSNDGDVTNNPAVIGAWLLVVDQLGEPIFSRVYAGDLGEQGIDIESLTSGYGLLIQSTSPELEGAENHGNFDVWIGRTNNVGGVDWAQFFGGTDADIPTALERIPGGFVISAASNSVDGDVVGNQGGYDYWVINVAITGELQWAYSYGGSDDDLANDLVVDDNGSIYVVGESESTDGDRTSFLGRSDVWVIKLDADGGLVWERTFGGSEDDVGTGIDVLSDGTLVVTADTRSSDIDLEDNNGRSDAWVLFLDPDDGSLIQQMNYGGSLDDHTDVVAVDSEDKIRILGSSPSRNQNLAMDVPPAENMWEMLIYNDTVPCTPNENCIEDDLQTGVFPVPTGVGDVCTNSCNVGLVGGPPGSGCFGFQGGTTWFKVKTDSAAQQMSVAVRSDEFNTPQIAVMQSANCSGFLPIACDIGSEGFVQIVNIDVEPDTAYFVVIGDAEGRAGDFSLCVSILDIEFCNPAAELYVTSTSKGSPLEGPYEPGEDVQFCYEIPFWNKIECNGLQGIQPTFGAGWDTNSFNLFGMPLNVDTMLVPVADGTWDWYPLGSVTYNFTNPYQGYGGGQGLPPGWYFTNLGDPPPTDGPDDTTGDLVTCLQDESTWKVCFTIRTNLFCEEDQDCSVTIKSFADGEIGSDVDQSCQFDDPIVFEANLKCCINPFINPVGDRTICSGDTVTVFLDSNLEPPVTYTWDVETNGSVIGAESGVGPVISQQLFNFSDEVSAATYTVSAISATGCEAEPIEFSTIIKPYPTAAMSNFGSDTVCAGDDVILRFSFVGTPPYYATFAINGIVQPEGAFEETPAFASVPLDASAQFSLLGYRDLFCEGTVSGTFSVGVKEHAVFDTVTTLCPGDSVVVGGTVFKIPGEFEVLLEGAAQNGCDSTINLLIAGLSDKSEFVEAQICEGDTFYIGDTPYTEDGLYEETITGSNGCDSTVTLALEVTNEIRVQSNTVACFGDVINFRGMELTEPGTYRDTVAITGECDSIYILNLSYLPKIELVGTEIIPDTSAEEGSILIEIDGGFPPYIYSWSTGDTTQDLENVPTGDYSVTITDQADCSRSFEFFISTSVSDPIAGIEELKVFPNPVASGSGLTVHFTNTRPDLTILECDLVNTNGQSISVVELEIVQGFNTMQMQIPGVASGLYLLVIREKENTGTLVRPVVVE